MYLLTKLLKSSQVKSRQFLFNSHRNIIITYYCSLCHCRQSHYYHTMSHYRLRDSKLAEWRSASGDRQNDEKTRSFRSYKCAFKI